MYCSKCNSFNEEGTKFCTVCGAPMDEGNQAYNQNFQTQNADYQNQSNNTANHNTYQQQYSAPMYSQNQYQGNMPPMPNADRVPSTKEYFLWMFLIPLTAIVPLLFPILCIIFACDKTYRAKSNYFKALLISWIVGICLLVVTFIIIFAICMAIGFSLPELLEDIYYEFSYSFM